MYAVLYVLYFIYILLLLLGSTVRHQYPCKIPNYKDDWFAELMLPEGAHNRNIDYTYIFLNRESPHIDQHLWTNPVKYKPPTISNNNNNTNTTLTTTVDDSNKEEEQTTIPYFLYGINLVKTKYDSNARRGAIVKAMCVFSRYHFLEIFKRPLEIALESYFNTPDISVLATLYTSLLSVDLYHVPRPNYLEQNLMRRGVTYEAMVLQEQQQSLAHIPVSHWCTTVPYILNDTEYPLRIPLYRTPDEIGIYNIYTLIYRYYIHILYIYLIYMHI